jgi:hypothetical protein
MKTKTVILSAGNALHVQVVGSIHFQWVPATDLNDTKDPSSTTRVEHRPVQYQWILPPGIPQVHRDRIALQIGEALTRDEKQGEIDGYNWREDQ